MNTRFEAHYGQDNCRLSRDQGILEVPVTQSTFCYRTCVRLLWNVPLEYSKSLEALWVDDVIYGNLWCQFVSVCLKEWAISVSIVSTHFLIQIEHFWLLHVVIWRNDVGTSTPFRTHISYYLFIGAIYYCQHFPWVLWPWLYSLPRFLLYLALCYYSATIVARQTVHLKRYVILVLSLRKLPRLLFQANFMAKACKEKTRFRTTSIIFSLPRSLLIWALIFTLIRVSALFAVSMGISTTIGLALLIVAAGCGFVLIRMAQKLFKNVRRSKTLHVQNQECKV